MRKRVLLTGVSGYIGRHVLPYLLEKGYDVYAVSRSADNPANGAVEFEAVDLLDETAVDRLLERHRPSHLLHLAWYVEHGKYWNAKENVDWLRASLRLAERFAECGGERIVTAGTCAEYDWTAAAPFTEYATRMVPASLYGAAKYSLFLTLSKLAPLSGLSFASGRVFFSFGPGEPAGRLVPSVIRKTLSGQIAATTHGEQVRDFLYVDDLARGFAELLDSAVEGPVNIASGRGVRLKEIAQAAATQAGGPELLRLGELPAAEGEPVEIVADISRLRYEVGFKCRWDMNEAMAETVNWWSANL
jgi:nucleoside-diphosphate-sugar epimerase